MCVRCFAVHTTYKMSIEFKKSGSEYIRSRIDAAVADGTRVAVITGNYEISSPIRIPSDFTLILDNAHLRLADGVFSNIFLNEHFDTDLGKTLEGTDRNIKIIGRGKAILDGGEYNGLSEKTQMKDGLPPIWNNNHILFSNVDGFEIRRVEAINQRWWAFCFVYCRNGRISDVEFCSNDSAIDEDGNPYRGLKRSRYKDVVVKNSDGIDLRVGCHDIVIENITGFTEDDSIALTALDWHLERLLRVEGLSPDIYNVEIRNVSTSAFCSNVRLLNQGTYKIHDIYIEGVNDTSAISTHMDRGGCGVRIGDASFMYGTRVSTADETYNITVRGVRTRALRALALHGGLKNVVIEDVEIFDGGGEIEDKRI